MGKGLRIDEGAEARAFRFSTCTHARGVADWGVAEWSYVLVSMLLHTVWHRRALLVFVLRSCQQL